MSEQLLQQILAEMQGIKTELKDVKAEQQNTNNRLDRIEAEVSSIKDEQQNTNGRLDRMETEQQTIKQAVLETNEHLDRIEKDTALIPVIQQAVMEFNQNELDCSAAIQHLEEGHARHDKILESLTVRFFEHDTDLRKLKQAK